MDWKRHDMAKTISEIFRNIQETGHQTILMNIKYFLNGIDQ